MSGQEVTVGKCGVDDIDAVVRLLGILFDQEADFSADPVRQRRALERVLAEPTLGVILVARRAGSPVGSVMLLHSVSSALGEDVCWLEDLIVEPAARNRGVGHALLDAAIEEARLRGWTRITLVTDADNVAAQALYRRHGFKRSEMVVLRRLAET